MNEADLRDKRLADGLRSALGEVRAPEDLVREALAVGRRSEPAAPLPAREPVLQLLLPQICGVLVLAGLGVALALRPELLAGLFQSLRDAIPVPDAAPPADYPTWVRLAGLVPLLMAVAGIEAGRGFRDFRLARP